MSFESLIDEDSVTIQKPTIAKDASGGSTHLPYTDRAVSPARVESLSSQQRLQYEQLAIPTTHRVFLPDGVDVENGDRLLTSDGVIIRVHSLIPQRGIGGIDTYLEVLGEQIQV